MGENSAIEWTDASWNCLVGCTRKSAGCDFCYAVTMSRRLEAMGKKDYAGLTTKKHFNGVVRCLPHKLGVPLTWKKPRLVFVNSMSDLFHDDVPFEFVDQVFAVMAICQQHTFQVLTKRPHRMAQYMLSVARANKSAESLERGQKLSAWCTANLDAAQCARLFKVSDEGWWYSPPNVWLGTSIENQPTADLRIPSLLATPAAVRFISLEPWIDPIDFQANQMAFDWLIVGCESRGRAVGRLGAFGDADGFLRGAMSLVAQCRKAGIPVFIKQLPINGKVSHDPAEWPLPLRVRQFPAGPQRVAS